MNIKIVFFGTPQFVLPVLEGINKTFKSNKETPIAAVVTQKPKPVGRKKILTYSPVDKWAHKRKIPIFYSADDFIKSQIHADIGILAAYGEIVSKKTISSFPHGILNIHASILPEFRGASPIQAAIIQGKEKTGATIMKLDEKLDHGPIVSKFEEEIKKEDTSKTLRDRIFEKSVPILCELLPAYIKGKINLKPQDHEKATYTREITKKDGFIPPEILESVLEKKEYKKDWEIDFIKDFSIHPDSLSIYNFTRAMDPWPGTWTFVSVSKDKKDKKRLKILKTKMEPQKLIIESVQLEGKNSVSWEQFKSGYPDFSF